jgi:secondary thiamine-phosphate synthase enzyme
METIALAPRCHHATIQLHTPPGTAFVDVTDQVATVVARSQVWIGTVQIQTTHTTTAILVNEHEPLLLADFEALLERLAPRDLPYWHDEMALRPGVPANEPRNGHAHCRALCLPVSASLNVAGGSLVLGRWQRIIFVELDGPRERTISVVVFGEVLP